MSEAECHQDEKVAFYSATINAWYATKLERDKSLLGLSSAGIALLVTLATAIGLSDLKLAVVYALAMLCFLFCIVCVLTIFERNATYLEKVLANDSSHGSLTILDKISSNAFVLGVIFTLLVGLFSAVDSFVNKGNYMDKQVPVSESNVTQNQELQINSFDGAERLRPSAQSQQAKPSPKEEANPQGSSIKE